MDEFRRVVFSGKSDGKERVRNGPSMVDDEQIGENGAGAVGAMFAMDIDLFGWKWVDVVVEFLGIGKFTAKRDVDMFDLIVVHFGGNGMSNAGFHISGGDDESNISRVEFIDFVGRRLSAYPISLLSLPRIFGHSEIAEPVARAERGGNGEISREWGDELFA